MKKQIRSAAAFLTSAACIVSVGAGAAALSGVLGDTDNDGAVGASDIRQVQDYLLGRNIAVSEKMDMNKDGTVNVFDLCLLKSASSEEETAIPDYGTAPDTEATMYSNFREGATSYFFASDGWSNGSCFDCVWRGSNAVFEQNALNLTISEDASGEYEYAGAEYRTSDHYHYGYYETSMQAIKNDGVVSSFFTYTGPSENNPWDEIDIEILGKDTTKVQLNYYTNGVGNHEVMYDLGFDASEGYHTYGFDWQEDHITWYVDGQPIHTAYDNIPTTPGRIMMNVWPGTGVDSWLNAYDGTTPLTARYQWVTYSEEGAADAEIS